MPVVNTGLFLHTAWRSRGTWAWETLRRQPGTMGFYEPLHEQLPSISTRRINALHNGNWQSGHPDMGQPYFAEYAPLLGASLVPGYRRRLSQAHPDFAFDRYFLHADSRHLPLRRYIESLRDAAAAAGCQPVMKFTRSQGRFPWFTANFPDIEHVLLVRQPWAQFSSGWRCFAGDDNPYFVAAPFMVLERNAADPDVAALIAALRLPITAQHWLRAVWFIDPPVLYRAMFALWLLSLCQALPYAETVLDADQPAAMAKRLGIINFCPKAVAAAAPAPPRISLAAIEHCHETSWRILVHRAGLEARRRIQAWIGTAEQAAASVLTAHAAPAKPPPDVPRGFPGNILPYGPPVPLI
jgi:hypothetical protein